MRVITAVILGGSNFNGGKVAIRGALIGLTFTALMQNILIIANVDAYWQNIIIGGVLVAVIALDAAFNRRGWN